MSQIYMQPNQTKILRNKSRLAKFFEKIKEEHEPHSSFCDVSLP